MDEHQLAEFDNHWSGTYAQVNKDLVFVHGASPVQRHHAVIRRINLNKINLNEEIPMKEVNYPRIEAGFYDVGPYVTRFIRLPTQAQKRGINQRNSMIQGVFVYNGTQSYEGFDLTWDRLSEIWTQYTSTPTKIEYESAIKDLLTGGKYGMTLSRGLSLFASPVKNKKDAGKPTTYQLMVVGPCSVIGKINHDNLTVEVKNNIRYIIPTIEEALQSRFNKAPEVISNA